MQETSTTETLDKEHTKAVAVIVNRQKVTFTDRKVTGLKIKETAIEQGVKILLDFVLYEVKADGKLELVPDGKEITLREGEEFRAVTPDDKS